MTEPKERYMTEPKPLTIDADSIVDTVREPLLVLDADLRVRRANRSFYRAFRVAPEETVGRKVYDLGNRQWDIPALRRLLEEVLPQNTVFNDFEVAHDFPTIGRKVMLLNARRVYREGNRTESILLAIEDITERRRIEDALAAQQEWLRVTLRSIGDAVIATDTAGRVTAMNPVAEALTGWTSREASGEPLERVFRIVNEETRQTVENPVTKAVREAAVVGLANHTLLIRKDGSERAIDDSAAPILTAEGNTIGVVLVFHDITERRRVERAAQDALDYAENVIETVREPMLVLDGQLRVRTANRSFYRAFEVSKPETEGRLLYDLGNGQWDIPKLRSLLEEVLPQNTVFNDFEVAHDFPAIGRKVMLLNARRIYREGNHTELILLAIEDITERRRLEDERRELETRFTSLVKNIRDHSIFTLDPQGHITSWNREAERILGYGEAEALGQHFSIIFTPEDREAGVPGQELATALSEGRAEDERWHLRKNGERFWALGIVTPTQDANGQHTGFSKILRDMTDRKRAEEALQLADRRKDVFLATLAHELRNPLAPIRNGLQIIRLTPDRAAREQTREMMERQLGQMVRLVDDLLDISRITRNKLEMRKARIDLSGVVQSAVETARPQVEAKGHTLTVTLPPQPVYLDGDLTRLAQVFWNLLHNAAKYTEPGGRISLTAEVRGGEAVVTVQDNGIGVPASSLPRLFEMFSQVDRSLERAEGGLGIGLALVKGLTEAHGGSVEVRSEGVGHGSSFVVRLPVAPDNAAPERRAAHDVAQPGPRHRILVVDDNRDGAASLAMLLTVLGNDTRTAHDGLEGVEMAGAFRPDLIVLDIGLPKLNGYDACRRIREQPWAKDIIIVAATGWGQEEDRRRSAEAGFDHHLVKPVDAAEVVRLLAKGRA
jgi:PAS domain S-box-containing protein